MTIITVLATAAAYTAVAAIGAFGLIYFGSLSARILRNTVQHA